MTARLAVPTLALALLVVAAGLAPEARAAVAVDDKFLEDQWGLARIGAPEAWDDGTGEGVVIAVVDTGIDLDHEDLKHKIVADVSCIGADDDATKCGGSGQDDHGHGSHVAGIAAAATNNTVGVAGTAPEAGIMAVRVLAKTATGDASGDLADVRAGIHWAVDHGADVINLSLGENVLIRNLFGSGLREAVDYAWSKGVLVAVAAGNTTSLFGSGYGGVPAFVVTATDVDNDQASYANDVGSAQWGLAAPGGDSGPDAGKILSSWLQTKPEDPDDTGYAYATGTSMATPFVSGAAAVLLSMGFTPQQVVDQLLATATDLGPEGEDSDFGSGLLNLAKATEGWNGSQTVEPQPAPPTTVPPTTPPPDLVLPAPPARVLGRNTPSPVTPPPDTTPSTASPAGEVASPPQGPSEPETAQAPLSSTDSSQGPAPWIIVGLTVIVVLVAGLRALARGPQYSRP